MIVDVVWLESWMFFLWRAVALGFMMIEPSHLMNKGRLLLLIYPNLCEGGMGGGKGYEGYKNI